jgi:hypothetical protein
MTAGTVAPDSSSHSARFEISDEAVGCGCLRKIIVRERIIDIIHAKSCLSSGWLDFPPICRYRHFPKEEKGCERLGVRKQRYIFGCEGRWTSRAAIRCRHRWDQYSIGIANGIPSRARQRRRLSELPILITTWQGMGRLHSAKAPKSAFTGSIFTLESQLAPHLHTKIFKAE